MFRQSKAKFEYNGSILSSTQFFYTAPAVVSLRKWLKKLGYNEQGYNEHSVTTSRYKIQISQINPLTTNHGNNEQK